MPVGRQFHTVALRAVDNMEAALPAARARVARGGQLAILTTVHENLIHRSHYRPAKLPGGSSLPRGGLEPPRRKS